VADPHSAGQSEGRGSAAISSFLSSPGIHLTPGGWTVTAITSFIEGSHCDGASRALETYVAIHVEG
jgi:hypothetical protein